MYYFRLVSAFLNKILLREDEFYHWLSDKVHRDFGHFVDHVLAESRRCGVDTCSAMDNHWKPCIWRCAFCSVDYTIVGKTETFEADVAAFFQLANLTMPSAAHVGVHNNANRRSQGVTRKYFSQLSRDQVWSLYKLYELDFELFGYSTSGYLIN